MKVKPYKAKSLKAAEREVRMLRKSRTKIVALFEEAHRDRVTLAMLAADGPVFHNPLEAMRAKNRRDEILAKWCRLKPDGRTLA